MTQKMEVSDMMTSDYNYIALEDLQSFFKEEVSLSWFLFHCILHCHVLLKMVLDSNATKEKLPLRNSLEQF